MFTQDFYPQRQLQGAFPSMLNAEWQVSHSNFSGMRRDVIYFHTFFLISGKQHLRNYAITSCLMKDVRSRSRANESNGFKWQFAFIPLFFTHQITLHLSISSGFIPTQIVDINKSFYGVSFCLLEGRLGE